MTFPLKDYKYEIPTQSPGSFGYQRKYNIHCGVDLYCEYYDEVITIEDGEVVNIINFTGESANSPWWNETKAVLVEGESGVIIYGEIDPNVKVGDKVKEGQLIGNVLTVLKKDKGKNPTNMLHIELHKKGTRDAYWWKKLDQKPESLLDITELLFSIN